MPISFAADAFGIGQGLFGGGSSVPTAGTPTNPYFDLLMHDATNYARNAGDYIANITNNPYSGQQLDFAKRLAPLGGQMIDASGQILAQAYDPQKALYDRTQQQITDQANAINAMYGLNKSGVGAGIVNQANTNFNIDWQNQLLQREIAGGQGAAATAGAGFQLGSAPYSTYEGQQKDILNAMAFGENMDIAATSPLLNYMRLQQSGVGLDQAANQQQFTQNQALGQGIGTGIGGLSSTLQGLNFGNTGAFDMMQGYQGQLGGFGTNYSQDPLANVIGYAGW